VAASDPWEPWRSKPGSAGILTDFDGTLAPIVDDPASARALPGTAGLLGRLAVRFALVGVVSGRPLQWLRAQLGAEGVLLAGLYGMERARDGALVEMAEAVPWRPVVAGAASELERTAPPGVGVERKGLTVTVHTRTAPEQAEWAARAAEDLAARTGLVLHPGRMSVELCPPIRADKGTVVAEVGVGLDALCFFGDDAGDLAAFAALADLRSTGVVTVAAAVASREAPAALLQSADIVLDGPEAVRSVLEDLSSGG
jgi:trehalose 6-phosphate phosphatase